MVPRSKSLRKCYAKTMGTEMIDENLNEYVVMFFCVWALPDPRGPKNIFCSVSPFIRKRKRDVWPEPMVCIMLGPGPPEGPINITRGRARTNRALGGGGVAARGAGAASAQPAREGFG
jgi:hypothetical protein